MGVWEEMVVDTKVEVDKGAVVVDILAEVEVDMAMEIIMVMAISTWVEDMVHHLKDTVVHLSMVAIGGGRGQDPAIVTVHLHVPVIIGGGVRVLPDGREIAVTEGGGKTH